MPEEGLDYRRFYNDAVNQEVNLKEDYRRWKMARGEFSFCEHPFVLEPASKSRVLSTAAGHLNPTPRGTGTRRRGALEPSAAGLLNQRRGGLE